MLIPCYPAVGLFPVITFTSHLSTARPIPNHHAVGLFYIESERPERSELSHVHVHLHSQRILVFRLSVQPIPTVE